MKILCCRHWRIPYVWTSFCSTRGGRRRPSTQSPSQWLSTESKSECEKICSFFERASAIKGLSELSYDWKCLFSPVWQNFGENMTFVSFHSGHVVMMLFLKLQILCKAGYSSTFVCVSQAYHLNFFLLQLFGYIGYKDTRSSIQKLLNFRYQKNKPNGQ